jgi:hypothetical protein
MARLILAANVFENVLAVLELRLFSWVIDSFLHAVAGYTA